MGEENELIKLISEIDVVQARIAERLAKGKENYTEEDIINAKKDDLITKQLMEKVKKLKK